MDFIFHTPLLVILLPMITAVLISLIQKPDLCKKLMTFTQVIAVVLSFLLFLRYLAMPDQSDVYVLGAFPAPWGNELRTGFLEAAFCLTFSLIMLASCLGGSKEVDSDLQTGKKYPYFIMLCLLSASMNALIFTNDIFTGYVFIEINTIAACAIVVAKESGQTLRATIKYLLMSILGSGLFLFATSILYACTGHLLMESAHGVIVELAKTGAYHLPLITTIALYTVAIGVKSALFPFHSWLPDAHGSATTTSSSILSSLVLKGYIILYLKLIFRVFGLDVIRSLGILPVIFVLGMAGMVAGSLMAFKQTDLKRMIAYSSVAQIGYIFMGIGMGTAFGLVAACFHIIAHAFTKSMLFLAAGDLSSAAGSKKITELKGVARQQKTAGIAFLVGSLSMIGMPLFAGFVSKFYLGIGALQYGTMGIIALVVLALSTFLNALYYVPCVVTLFAKPGESSSQKEKKEPGSSFSLASLVLIVLIVFNLYLGIFYAPLLRAIEIGLNAFV